MIRPRSTPYILALTLAMTAACASKKSAPESAAQADSTTTVSDGDATIELNREIDGVAVGVELLVHTNNNFAFDLYRSTRTDNFVVSPHGLAGSLALLHAAAEGDTAVEIAKTLRVDIDERDLHGRFRQLRDALQQRATSTSRDVTRGFRLSMSPGVWLSDGVEPSTQFLQVATNQHLATIERFDFQTQHAAATASINAHYADATGGKLGTVVADLKPATKLLLTSTVQFDAPWALPFERGLTEEAKVTTAKGARTVPMMHGRIRIGYLDGEGFQLAELPYADGLVSAWVVLPDEGNDTFDATLTSDYFDWMVESARHQDVDIRLPRFEVTTRQSFREVLKSMGTRAAFDPQAADLSALGSDSPLAVDDVIGVARIKVDEDGSDAVATVRGPVAPSSGKIPHFEASRPFLFIVRDTPTGAILAIARIAPGR